MRYAFVKRVHLPPREGDRAGNSRLALSTHRLTQIVVRNRLADRRVDASALLRMLCCSIDRHSTTQDRFGATEYAYSHIIELQRFLESDSLDMELLSSALCHVVTYLTGGPARYLATVPIARTALRLARRSTNKQSLLTLHCASSLANALRCAGRYRRALTIQCWVQPQLEANFSSLHRPIAAGRILLGRLYYAAGRHQSALQILEPTIEYCQLHFSPNDAQLLESKLVCAQVRRDAGDVNDAIVQLTQVRSVLLSIRPSNQTLLLTVSHELALALHLSGRLSEAATLQRETLNERMLLHGVEHPDYLGAANNLGTTLLELGDLSEAEALLRHVANASAKALTPKHPDTLVAAANLTAIDMRRGGLDRALPELQRILEELREQLDDWHPFVQSTLNSLGYARYLAGQFDEALRIQAYLFDLQKRELPTNHPHTLSTMNNLALTLHALGRRGDAIRLLKDAIKRMRQRLGRDHPNTLASVDTLRLWRSRH